MVRDAVNRNRTGVLTLLRRHSSCAFDAHEAAMTDDTIRFIEAHADCFLRSQLMGHVTGSAWVVDSSRSKVLLMHHAKLDKWVQLGGHADGDPDLWAVAQREAREESGLTRWGVTSKDIFDVDRHLIPERQGVPEHFHYDLRFLFQADPDEALTESSESKGLSWIPLEQVAALNPEESMARMVRKTPTWEL